MKKRWYGIITVAIALLVLAVNVVPTLAQSQGELLIDPEPVPPAMLAIKAPRVAPVGAEVTMTVFQRGTQSPIEDAGIWALTRNEAWMLKAEMTRIRERGDFAIQEQDYESLVSVHGTLLGRTDGNGQLRHTFDEEGGYLLVAVKTGFIPGFAPIAVRTIPDALGIKAPRVAPVGAEMTMTVFQRGTQSPIEDAGVWALTWDEAQMLKAEMTRIRERGDFAIQEQDYESLVSVHGTLLGRTDGNGQLRHTFDEEGGYLLVAVKTGFIPGFAPIGIRAIPSVPPFEAPDWQEPAR